MSQARIDNKGMPLVINSLIPVSFYNTGIEKKIKKGQEKALQKGERMVI